MPNGSAAQPQPGDRVLADAMKYVELRLKQWANAYASARSEAATMIERGTPFTYIAANTMRGWVVAEANARVGMIISAYLGSADALNVDTYRRLTWIVEKAREEADKFVEFGRWEANSTSAWDRAVSPENAKATIAAWRDPEKNIGYAIVQLAKAGEL